MPAARLNSCIAAFSSVTLAGLAVAGCSSSTPTAAAAATPDVTVSPSPTGLATKLLTPADLSGWQTDVTPSEGPGATNCPVLNAPLWNAPLPNHAEADLSKGLSGPYLVEQVAAGTADQAGKAWQMLAAGVPQCTTYTHNGSAGQSTDKLVQTSRLPSYGDASYAFNLTITITGGVNASGNIVAVRTGNSIAVVYIVGLTGVSRSVVEDVVSKAVAKART